jgi:hypothetical protein
MRFLGAAPVCIAIFKGVDALFFDDQYGDGIDRTLWDIYRHC